MSLYWNFCSMILSSWGSANVSFDLITSSSCFLSLRHSSMYILISISVSWVLVFLMLRFNNSTSSLRVFNSSCCSRTLRFKFITRWCESALVRWEPNLLAPVRLSVCYYCISSSIILSLRVSSFSVICRRVLNLVFSSFRLFVAILCFITSSYNRSLSYSTTLGLSLITSCSMATVLALKGWIGAWFCWLYYTPPVMLYLPWTPFDFRPPVPGRLRPADLGGNWCG